MRKFIVFLICTALSVNYMVARGETDNHDYKPTSFSLNIVPYNYKIIETWGIWMNNIPDADSFCPSLLIKHFTSANTALRVDLSLALNSSNGDTYDSSEFGFSFSPGYEKHYGNGQVRHYFGIAFPFGFSEERSSHIVSGTGNTTFHNNYSIGIEFVMGANYYISDGFFVGLEFTPGVTWTINNPTEYNGVENAYNGYKSFKCGIGPTSGITIGFRF
jgi:hypothetical protein